MLSILRSSFIYSYLRKIRNRRKRSFLKKKKKLSINEMRNILIDELKIKKGDNLLVHCGFGFLNPSFSPEELLTLIKEVVGSNGTIAMPYYPTGLSCDFLESDNIFDVNSVRCGTGVLAHTLAKNPRSIISKHPIKALVAIGIHSNEICKNHDSSQFPFDNNSPYFKLANLSQSKSIGLGVRNCSMFHCAEDLYEHNKSYLYMEKLYIGKVKQGEDIFEIKTFAHKSHNSLLSVSDFLNEHYLDLLTLTKNTPSPSYSISNYELLKRSELLFSQGYSRKEDI